MKIQLALILASSLLPIACGQQTSQGEVAKKSASAAMTSEEKAANDLYLDDTIDSSTDEASDTDSSTSDEENEEVKDDIKSDRLEQMASMLLEVLDADESGALSLEEYLVGPAQRAVEIEAGDDVLAQIKKAMTEDFNKFAGSDAQLSSEELQELLKAAAPRVARHRFENFPGKNEERIEKSAEDILKTYDKDGDGSLDASELEALMAAKKAEMEEFRKKHMPESGDLEGGVVDEDSDEDVVVVTDKDEASSGDSEELKSLIGKINGKDFPGKP